MGKSLRIVIGVVLGSLMLLSQAVAQTTPLLSFAYTSVGCTSIGGAPLLNFAGNWQIGNGPGMATPGAGAMPSGNFWLRALSVTYFAGNGSWVLIGHSGPNGDWVSGAVHGGDQSTIIFPADTAPLYTAGEYFDAHVDACNGGVVYVNFSYVPAPTPPPPPPPPCSSGVVYSASLTGDSGAEANNAFRSQTTATTAGTGCGHVTVEFAASAGGGPMTVNHASICVQSSGSACASAPVPLLVGGSASFTVAQGATQTSDPAAFSFTTGQILLVTLDFGSPANARATGTGPGFYYCFSCGMSSQQNPAGLSVITTQGPIGFDKITALQ